MIAYHGDPAIKDKYLKRVRAHRLEDQLQKGFYWEDGKGCAVGCTVHSDDHAAYETELGIPQILARLEDGIFENLPNGKAMEWPEKFLNAIPVGADLSKVWPLFAIWLLTSADYGIIKFAKRDKSKLAIQAVSDAYQAVVDGVPYSQIDWKKLRADAAAAADAAYAAADAAYAAAAAAYAAAAAAASARESRERSRILQSEKLLQLLSDAPIPEVARRDVEVA